MTRDQALLLAVGGLAAVCLVLSLALLRLWSTVVRTGDELSQLRDRLEDLNRREMPSAAVSGPVAAPVELLITDLRSEQSPAPDSVHLDGSVFADILLREAVVKAASLAHGVRRGLAPETRNRIRFQMRREVRRAHKQRRADLRAAQHELHARQRATPTEEAS